MDNPQFDEKELYKPEYLESLFDSMSASYGRVNYITSFGFSKRWRNQCVKAAGIADGAQVADLMTGMGECWGQILAGGTNVSLTALDISANMLQQAHKQLAKHPKRSINVLKANVFENSIPPASHDAVVSGFGIKTFNSQQLEAFAAEVKRILKPGGAVTLIEVSVPGNRLLRALYMFYVKRIIPTLGWLFLGNPDNYRMLGIYTERFVNAKETEAIFTAAGFEVRYVSYFHGCATGIVGIKPRN